MLRFPMSRPEYSGREKRMVRECEEWSRLYRLFPHGENNGVVCFSAVRYSGIEVNNGNSSFPVRSRAATPACRQSPRVRYPDS